MYIPVNMRTKRNPLYYKLRTVKDNMMSRCYNKNNPKYKSYGAQGVRVDERWHKLSNFLEDVDRIEGWDEELFLANKLRLDKDTKVKGNKVYSLNTCRWVSPEENSKHKPNAQRDIIAIAPDGTEMEFYNQTDFAKKHGLDRISIHDCLVKKISHHYGWQFYFKGDSPPKKRVKYVAEKNGVQYVRFSIAELARDLNIPAHKLYSAYRPGRRNDVNGYTFYKM